MLILGMMQIIVQFDNITTTAVSPSPRDDVDGAYVQYLFGDWNVTGVESYTDEIFVLTGNLTILAGGALTLRNVTLAINCTTENGTYDIQVMDGGSLNITDGDNDPATTDDRSNITDSPFDTDDYTDVDYRYSIKAWQGSSISIENSIIREAGFPFGTNDYGLYIYTDNVNIQNCTIERNWYGLHLRGNNHRFAYNEIRYCNEYAMYIVWSPYLQFYNNLIHYNENGVYTTYSNYANIYNNHIHNNSNAVSKSTAWGKKGLEILRSDYSNIFNNRFVDNCGFTWSSNLNIYDCPYSKVFDNIIHYRGKYGGWSVELGSASYFEFYNNTITNNNCSVLYISPGGNTDNNVKIFNNNISNNGGTGIQITGYSSATTNIEIKNNKLYNNAAGMRLRELKTYDIQNNVFMNCSSFGVYVNDVAGGDFSNNTINSTGDDFILRDSYGPNDDTVFEVVNCSCDPTKTTIIDGKPKLVIMNFLHLNVTDKNSLVRGASINIKNNTGVTIFTGESDVNGSIKYIKIKNQTVDTKGTIYYDPYNITATLDVFTAYGDVEPTMNISQTVNVHFNIDLPPLPPSGLVAESVGTNVVLNWEPSQSKDTIHYLVYRNGTGPSWVLVYNSSLNPPKELWTNWTDVGGAATPSTFSYKVVAIDHLWQPSEDSEIVACGDWVVDNPQIINGLNVQLNGSLTILPTGNLTLQNSKIKFNNSFNGQYGINVHPGGVLYILDADNDPQTTTDQSVISALNPNKNLFFQVTSAKIIMRNSKLSNCGFDERAIIEPWEITNAPAVLGMGETRNRGLYILDSEFSIESNEFTNNFVSILIDMTSGGNVYDNTFSDNSFGIFLNKSNQITLNDNTFSNHDGFPTYLLNSENNQIYSNTITNPSSTTAGIGVYDFGCRDNKIFQNDLIDGEAGVFIWDAGNNNNVSDNNFDGQEIGIVIINTWWNTLLDNDFNDTSNSTCYLWNAHYNTIRGGSSTGSNYGYNFYFSSNIDISNLNVQNSVSSAIKSFDSTKINVANLVIDGSNFGLHIRNGEINMIRDITISNCTTGIYCYNIKPDIYLIDSQMLVGMANAIVLNQCDWLDITNCTFDATQHNFDLENSNVVLFNTTYNQSRVLLDPSSGIALLWPVDIQVIDWWGNPASNTNLQIRKVMGTIIYNGFTDNNGWVRWLWLLERIQFSHSNESSTPHFFKGISGNHSGETTLLLNQSTSITVYLENEIPSVSNIAIHPPYPDTTAELTLEYQYSDEEFDPEDKTIIRWNVRRFNKDR
jgi:parallel beta-helix repeat protein